MWQTYLILAIAVLTTVTAQLFFKQGMNVIGDLTFNLKNIGLIIISVFKNGYLLTGLSFYAISFVLWLFVLAKINLSVAYPITAMNFVLVILFSFLIFKEAISPGQIASIILICLGVAFLGLLK